MIQSYVRWSEATGINLFLFLLVASSILLIIAAIVIRVLPRLSAATRYYVWLAAFTTTLLVPLTLLPLPGIQSVRGMIQHDVVSIDSTTNTANTHSSAIPFEITFSERATFGTGALPAAPKANVRAENTVVQKRPASLFSSVPCSLLIVSIWLLGSLGMAGRLIAIHWQVRRLIKTSQPGILSGEPVRFCSHIQVPATVGVFRSKVLVPFSARHWAPAEIQAILSHEFAHVRRKDVFTQLVVSLTKCIVWFQPLAWVGNRKMLLERELACDNSVLETGTGSSFYAEALCKLATELSNDQAQCELAMYALQKPIEYRLHSILDQTVIRTRPRLATIVMMASLFSACWLTFAVVMADSPSSKASTSPTIAEVPGNTTSTPSQPTNQEDSYSGQIIDENNEPIADATVRVTVYQLNSSGFGTSKQLKEIETTTDQSGTYQFEFVAAESGGGSFLMSIAVSNDDCWQRLKSVREHEITDLNEIPTIQLKQGRTVVGKLVFDKTKTSELVAPTVVAYGTVFDRAEGNTHYYETFLLKTKAQANGEFEFIAPKDAEIGILATADSYSVARITLSKDATTVPDISLPNGVQVSGVLRDRDNNPLPNKIVHLAEDQGFFVNNTLMIVKSSVKTDRFGRYKFPAHHGNCTISVGLEGDSTFGTSLFPDPREQPCVLPVQIELKADSDIGEVVLTESAPQRLSGQILLEDGDPAQEVEVMASVMGGGSQIRIATTQTDMQGNYTVTIPKGGQRFFVQVFGTTPMSGEWLHGIPNAHPKSTGSSTQSIWFENVTDDLDDIDWTLKSTVPDGRDEETDSEPGNQFQKRD